MNNKKNIDRLFQEKFKDFEVAPPDFIWQNLEAQLEEKNKKRRAVPLWYKLSGVAAILIIGMFILMPFMDNSRSSNGPAVTGTQETNPDGSRRITPINKPLRQGQTLPDTEVASGERKSSSVTVGSGVEKSYRPSVENNDAIAAGDAATPSVKNKNNQHSIKATTSHSDAVAYNGNRNTKGGRSAGTENKKNTTTNNKKNIATPVSDEEVIARVTDQNNTIDKANGIDNKENSIAIQRDKSIAAAKNKTNVPVKENIVQPEDVTGVNKIVIPEEIKNEAVAQSNTVIDSANSVDPENELEKLLQQKLNGENEEKAEVADNVKKNRWNVKPQMAPLFFNTAAQGSPIDANLAANSKDFDSDMSYGVGLNYAITDRITIRSGVNTVNMKYSTNDVAYYATLESQPLTGMVAVPDSPHANLVVGSTPADSPEATTEIQTQQYTGSLVQKMGFVEVPLEMSYKLVNRRFGIDLIGGVSTLFLNDNNVTLLSDKGFSSNMGEAKNINNISFSTNVGVGFKYRFLDAFEASFEPMFKYQLNTFSNNDGNFKPYFIGLYSGISFSF